MDIKYIFKEARYYYYIEGLSRAIKKFFLSQTFLSKIVNKKLYNKIYNKIIRKKVNIRNPFILQVENTNFCNAKCIMCPHTIMKRKCKVMSQEDFEKIINNVIKNYKIKRFTMTGFGEPLIDPGLIKKIEFLNKNYPQINIEIYTNGALLNSNLIEKLLNMKIKRITFSINGTEESYRKIMSLDYKNTKEKVLLFLKRKKELKSKTMTNVSLMILKENQEDVERFIKFWRKHADSVRVYAPSNWAGAIDLDIVTKDSFYKKRWPCYALWSSITVDVEGNLIMCCRDYESKIKFGNLIKEDIEKIRQGNKFQELLKKQENFDFNSEICKNCDNVFDSSLDWLE